MRLGITDGVPFISSCNQEAASQTISQMCQCYMLHTVFVNNLHGMTLGLLTVRFISEVASYTDSMSARLHMYVIHISRALPKLLKK